MDWLAKYSVLNRETAQSNVQVYICVKGKAKKKQNKNMLRSQLMFPLSY